MAQSSMFIGKFEFEGPGSHLTMTLWQGNKAYQFSTNFIGVYPNDQTKLKKKKTIWPASREKKISLEKILVEQGLEKSDSFDIKQGEYAFDIIDKRIVQLFLDKRDYDKLPEEATNELITCHTQSMKWDFGIMQKAEIESWLLKILKEKSKLDQEIDSLYKAMLRTNKKQLTGSLDDITSFIKKDYHKDDFDKKIIPLLFESIGYRFKQQEDKNLLIHLFQQTRYSFKHKHHYINAQKKVFEPLDIEIDYPKLTDKKNDAYYKKILKKPFGRRFLENSKQVLGEKGIDAIFSKDKEIYILKSEQEELFNTFKRLLSHKAEYPDVEDYVESIKYQLEDLFCRVQYFNLHSKTRKDLRKLVKEKLEEIGGEERDKDNLNYDKKIFERAQRLRQKKQDLESRIKQIKSSNTLKYDFDYQRTMLFLDIMHRHPEVKGDDKLKKKLRKKIYFEGIKPKGMINEHEWLDQTPSVFLDIEKFQYGTPEEVINAIISSVRRVDGEYIGRIDTDIDSGEKNILGFQIKHHHNNMNLMLSSADFINPERCYTYFTQGDYDFKHLSKTRLFRTGKEKVIVPRQKVHEEFIRRYDIPGVSINTVTLAKIIWPHLLNHRLATLVNKLYQKEGTEKVFEKSFDYEELREQAGLAKKGDKEKAYDILYYGGDDVDKPFKAWLHPKARYIFKDLLEVCNTFGITPDQASSNANTAAHLFEKRFYEKSGGILSPGIFRQKHQELAKEFRNKYTEYRTKHLLEQGLKIDFERGVQDNVSQLYFSPELFICKVLYPDFPGVKAFVDRTMRMKNPERKVSRLQYVKPFVVSMLTDLYGIHKIQDEIKVLEKEKAELLEEIRGMPESQEKQSEKEQKIKAFGGKWEKIIDKLISMNNKKYFFGQLFGVKCEKVEERVQQAYKTIADVINENDIHPLQIKGNFIYAKENLPDKVLRKAGLFRMRNMRIFNMQKNELTFHAEDQYAGYPPRLDRPGFHYSMFQTRIIKEALDRLLQKKEDYLGVLNIINTSSTKLSADLPTALVNPKLEKNQAFIQDLLKYNRTKNRYVGNDEKGKREFTEHNKKFYRPDPKYFMRKFYGKTSKDIDVHAPIAKLFGGIINLGEDNSSDTKKEFWRQRQMYRQLISETMLSRQELKQILNQELAVHEPGGQFIIM
ncbi:hypothetical protein KY348_00535 [Candidatus Woesearchaeota archaeon]|nr:hypothetical protein [Candidatus Woesearchaeota archaeon]